MFRNLFPWSTVSVFLVCGLALFTGCFPKKGRSEESEAAALRLRNLSLPGSELRSEHSPEVSGVSSNKPEPGILRIDSATTDERADPLLIQEFQHWALTYEKLEAQATNEDERALLAQSKGMYAILARYFPKNEKMLRFFRVVRDKSGRAQVLGLAYRSPKSVRPACLFVGALMTAPHNLAIAGTKQTRISGAGTAFLSETLREWSVRGDSETCLVLEPTQHARAFYEKLGFVAVDNQMVLEGAAVNDLLAR